MSISRFAVLSIIGILLALTILLRERPAGAQTVPDVLRAQAIELVDPRGRVRAQLNVESSGEVVFRLTDSTGTIRVKLGASEEGSGLLLANEATEPGVHLLATRNRTFVMVRRGERSQVITPEALSPR
jgi:hypothetical protein